MPERTGRGTVAYVIADYKTPALASAARRSILHHGHEPVAVVDASAGLSYSAALNRGVGRCQGYAPDIWCFLNADVEMLEDDRPVIDLFAADPDLGIVGPRQVASSELGGYLITHGGIVPHEDGTEWDLDLRHRCWRWPVRVGRIYPPPTAEDLTGGTFEVPMVPGSVFYIRARCLEQVGGWPEDFRFYYEDASVCYMARHLGWRVLYTGAVTWLHQGEQSPVRRSWRLLQMARSRSLFIAWCAERGIPLRDVPEDEEGLTNAEYDRIDGHA